MNVVCPECNSADNRTLETREAEKGTVDRRRHICRHCGVRWTTRATVEEGSIVRATGSVVKLPVNATRSVSTNKPPPTGSVQPPTGSGGGVGGGVSENPIRSESDLNPKASLLSEPRGRARSSRSANAEYPGEFEILWAQTGKRGGKFPAFKAWKGQGQPTWAAVQAAWRAYLLSERPVAGFIKDLSSWLNARGHLQEWFPAAPARRRTGETFEARRKREHEDAVAAESERMVFGSGWSR